MSGGTPSPIAASVIIACYNDSDIVERNLAGFSRQSFPDFELILADDGSQEDYSPLLRKWAPHFRHTIRHVWQEDRGFRKTRILNRAVSVSRSDRLIFVDMDCLPHRDFVRNHLRYLQPGAALAGRRVNVRRSDVPSAEEIFRRGMGFGPLRLFGLWLRGRARLIEHGIILPFSYEIPHRGILGCNFSIYKADLEKINGFNAEFEGPGWEDTDIDYRLQLAGIGARTLRHKLVEYHVDHPVRVTNSSANQSRLEAAVQGKSPRAVTGLAEIRQGDFEDKEYSANGSTAVQPQ